MCIRDSLGRLPCERAGVRRICGRPADAKGPSAEVLAADHDCEEREGRGAEERESRGAEERESRGGEEK